MKYLLPPVRYYKANFHTHTTVSDGKLTPEEIRDAYKEQGYSILALTDHSVVVEHQGLNQEDFLLLTGVEIDINDVDSPVGDVRGRQRHLCLIAKDPMNNWVPFRDPNPIPVSVQYEKLDVFGGMSREYSPENINAVIAECNKRGYLVIYNHPVWSLESYPDYAPMKGLWGMEYRNSCSLSGGHDENNSQVYQDLSVLGNRIMPVCADDTHRPVHPNGYRVLGNSWNMIGAEKLDYPSVIAAMEKGELYGSCGPEIHSLSWEDNKLTVRCSPAAKIQVVTYFCWAKLALAGDEPLTEATFPMEGWVKRAKKNGGFLRLIVTAANGTYAVTRSYWLDELEEREA